MLSRRATASPPWLSVASTADIRRPVRTACAVTCTGSRATRRMMSTVMSGRLHLGVADLFLDGAGQQSADHLAAHGRSPAALRDGVGNEFVAVPLEIGRLHPAPAFRY